MLQTMTDKQHLQRWELHFLADSRLFILALIILFPSASGQLCWVSPGADTWAQMRFLRKCISELLCVYSFFYYQQSWLCLFKVAWHFPLQNLISSCPNWTIWSYILQANSQPLIQKFVRGMCIFIWSYQASPSSSFLKVKDTNTLLYKQYFCHIKNTVLWWELMLSHYQECLPAQWLAHGQLLI